MSSTSNGCNYLNLILPEDRKSFTGWMKENLKGKMENSVDYRIFLKGNIFYIRLKAFAREREKDGNVTIEGYIQNITDIQKAAQRHQSADTCHQQLHRGHLFGKRRRHADILPTVASSERHGIGNRPRHHQMKIYDLPSYGRDETPG